MYSLFKVILHHQQPSEYFVLSTLTSTVAMHHSVSSSNALANNLSNENNFQLKKPSSVSFPLKRNFKSIKLKTLHTPLTPAPKILNDPLPDGVEGDPPFWHLGTAVLIAVAAGIVKQGKGNGKGKKLLRK